MSDKKVQVVSPRRLRSRRTGAKDVVWTLPVSKGEAGRRVTRLKLVSSDRIEAYVVQMLDEEGPATRVRSSDSHETEICVGWIHGLFNLFSIFDEAPSTGEVQGMVTYEAELV